MTEYQHDMSREADRRRARRYEGHFRVRFKNVPAFESEFRTNISFGGLFVHTQKDLALDSEVLIELFPAPNAEPFTLSGRVVRRSNSPAGVAIQFIDLSPDMLRQMEALFGDRAQPIPDRRGEAYNNLPLIEYRHPSLGDLAEDMMLNFSFDGGTVYTSEPLEPASECMLRLGTVQDGGPEIEMVALVLELIHDQEGVQTGARVKFLTNRTEDREAIKRFARELRDTINLLRRP